MEHDQSRVREIVSDIETSLDLLEDLSQGLTAEFEILVLGWTKEAVERQVMQSSRLTEGRGTEALRQVKVGLTHLLKEIPKLVAREFAKEDVWPHRKINRTALSDLDLAAFEDKLPERDGVRDALGKVLSFADLLLEKHRFGKANLRVLWSSEMYSACSQYGRIWKQIRQQGEIYKIAVASKERSKLKAAWDQL